VKLSSSALKILALRRHIAVQNLAAEITAGV
jgi:hypothetical protein